MGTWKPALPLAIALAACTLPWTKAKPTICYPPPPSVTPDHATPRAILAVASAGYENPAGGSGCGPLKRLATYVIQLRTESDVQRHLDGARANRLGVVRVDVRSLAFRTEVAIPPGAMPGPYYVGYARALGDHYHFRCPEGAACAATFPQDGDQTLTVVPRAEPR